MIDSPKRGELWWCETEDFPRRPVVVLSRNETISRLRASLIAPCTTTIRNLQTEVRLDPEEDPIWETSAVNLDSVYRVSLGFLTQRIGRLSARRMAEVCDTLGVATAC